MPLFNIRVGDILLSINGEEVNGKPISKVQEMINTVPRGNVQLIAKSSNLSEEAIRRKSISILNAVPPDFTPGEPFTQCIPAPSQPHKSESVFSADSDFETLAPPPPPKLNTLPEEDKRKNYLGFSYSSTSRFYQGVERPDFRDDMSDLESLPAAPPRPKIPLNLPLVVPEQDDQFERQSNLGLDENDDSDTDSMLID